MNVKPIYCEDGSVVVPIPDQISNMLDLKEGDTMTISKDTKGNIILSKDEYQVIKTHISYTCTYIIKGTKKYTNEEILALIETGELTEVGQTCNGEKVFDRSTVSRSTAEQVRDEVAEYLKSHPLDNFVYNA